MVADQDLRTFQNFIDWDVVSSFVDNMEALDKVLNTDREVLLRMGQSAREVYYRDLNYGEWCRFIIDVLEGLT